jgi:uncharacterized membrane protein YfcA
LLLAFAPKPSSGLSQASIFGASLGGLILNIQNKHPFTFRVQKQGASRNNETQNGTETISSVPTTDNSPENTDIAHFYTRPLIDYDMALFLAPMEMAGAVLGVLVQKILPNWLYLLIASIILGFTAYKTYIKWWDSRNVEIKRTSEMSTHSMETSGDTGTQTPQQQSEEETTTTSPSESSSLNPLASTLEIDYLREESATSLDNNPSAVKRSPSIAATHKTDQEISTGDAEFVDEVHEFASLDPEKIARRDHLLARDSRQYPAEKLLVFCVLWAGLTLLTFLKGGKGVDSIIGITCEDVWYGVLIAVQFLWTLGFATFFAWKLQKDTAEKHAVGYPFHPEDVLWDFSKTRFYAFFTFVAGIVAGLIGVGGGMVLGPLMLVMGIHPRVSTATTATMIVLTSSSVAILFVTSGLVPWEYAICFFCTCFVGAFVGKTYIDGYVKKTGKASILILLLATIIAFATVGTLAIVLMRLVEANWCFAGFNQFCSVSSENDQVECVPSSARLLQPNFIIDVISTQPL